MPGLTPLRPDTDDDILQVMNWRNDAGTRIHFFHQEPKVWPAYRQEFLLRYADTPILPHLIHEDGRAGGFLGFQRSGEGGLAAVAAVDILIAPEARGQGLGSWALRQVPRLASAAGVREVVAEIKAQNAASIRIFEKAGFECLGSAEKFVPDTGETHSVIRYAWRA